MKTRAIVKMTSALVLTIAAGTALAASPYGEKPRCPMGQVAQPVNGHWECKPLSIKSNDRGGLKMSTASVPAKVQAKQAPKPDLDIISVQKLSEPGKFRVLVKNLGSAVNVQTVLWATQQKKNGQKWGGAENVQAIDAGQQAFVDVTIGSSGFDRGDRLIFTADYYKKVDEKNEGNNTYTMVY